MQFTPLSPEQQPVGGILGDQMFEGPLLFRPVHRRMDEVRAPERVQVGLDDVHPQGQTADQLSRTLAPEVRIGAERMYGQFGFEAGYLGRFERWNFGPDSTGAMASISMIETLVYGQLAVHSSRIALHGGAALGAATKVWHDNFLVGRQTTSDFEVNLFADAQISLSRMLAASVGVVVHPPDTSTGTAHGFEYVAFCVGLLARK